MKLEKLPDDDLRKALELGKRVKRCRYFCFTAGVRSVFFDETSGHPIYRGSFRYFDDKGAGQQVDGWRIRRQHDTFPIYAAVGETVAAEASTAGLPTTSQVDWTSGAAAFLNQEEG